jgi:hypothetical protein
VPSGVLAAVAAILNSSATTSLCYRDLRGLIVGEAVVTLATPEYLAERVIQNGHPGQNASAFVVVKKISNEHP